MNVELRAQGVRLNDGLRSEVDRRLRYTLGRFGQHVRHVHVTLADINGPKGGEDIRCRIRANVAPSGILVIQETRHDPFAAVARACDRLGHSVSRSLERLHSRRRGR